MSTAFWRTLFRPASRRTSEDDLRSTDTPLGSAASLGRSAIQTAATSSITARIQRFLGLGLLAALTLVFLTWYYAHAFARAGTTTSRTQSVTAAAQGESTLPPLDSAPRATTTPAAITPPSGPGSGTFSPYVVGNILTDTPSADDPSLDPDLAALERANAPNAQASQSPTRLSSAERRLSGVVFARSSSTSTPPAPIAASPDSNTLPTGLSAYPNAAVPEISPTSAVPTNPLDALLKPHLTPAVIASLLPTQRLLLPKGASIDCTLETAIDSTLPGLATCLTAVDTYSANGQVVLLERGTKLIGEARGSVEQGASRLFVLWTEARTPNGVVVTLDSPGTDELGRSGLTGQTNRHFADRFGSAILVSMIDGAIQGVTQSARSSGASVTYNATGSRDVLTEVLRSTINIPPTITKQQGDRIQILVARDLDFRSVYALQAK